MATWIDCRDAAKTALHNARPKRDKFVGGNFRAVRLRQQLLPLRISDPFLRRRSAGQQQIVHRCAFVDRAPFVDHLFPVLLVRHDEGQFLNQLSGLLVDQFLLEDPCFGDLAIQRADLLCVACWGDLLLDLLLALAYSSTVRNGPRLIFVEQLLTERLQYADQWNADQWNADQYHEILDWASCQETEGGAPLSQACVAFQLT